MKRMLLIFITLTLVGSLLGGCSHADHEQSETTMVTPASREVPAAPSTPALAPTEVPVPTSMPTPAPLEKFNLDIPEPINNEILTANGDGTSTVDITEDVLREEYFRNVITMPSYIWHINPNVNEGIKNVVVEFDLQDVCHDSELAGFDRGYLIGLTDTETLKIEIKNDPEIYYYDLDFSLPRPFFMTDMDKYAQKDAGKIKITIPYDVFMTAARDIVLQFIPGATFSNLEVYIEGENLSDIDMALLTEKVEKEYVNAVLPYINDNVNTYELHENDEFFGEVLNKLSPFRRGEIYFSYFADDGSCKMVLDDLDIEGYEGELDFEFGIVPEGLFYYLMPRFFDRNYQQININELVRFVMDNMRSEETGLISGIWDSENHRKVAEDRTSANFPLMLLFVDYLSDEEIAEMFYASLNHEVLQINGKYYYAPHGMENGKMALALKDLSDVAGMEKEDDEGFYNVFGIVKLVEMLLENGTVTERDAAIYTSAIANSLQLVLEAQQNNPTRLPAESIIVTFTEDGKYTLENGGDEFNIDNYYYLSILNARDDRKSAYKYMNEKYMDVQNKLSPDLNQIENNMYALNIYRNCFAINLFEYKIIRGIYDFIKVQDENTRFAPRYNLYSGEPLFNDGSLACPYLDTYNRFGSPKEFMNWMAIAGSLTDYELLYEMEALMADYHYEVRNLDFYAIDYYYLADKLNIDVNKDFICANYNESYLGANTLTIAMPPPDAESVSWRLSTGEYLKFLYRTHDVALSDEAVETIESLSCEPLY